MYIYVVTGGNSVVQTFCITSRRRASTLRKMDESWRMRMGISTSKSNLPHRKSTEETSRRDIFGDSEALTPEDFEDVFGGPPRSVLSRQFSGGGEFAIKGSFYEEIFRSTERVIPTEKAEVGRNLPEFRIPGNRNGRRICDGFYSDVFLTEEDIRRSRSRSKSKASSSSVLSSEELSPLRPAVTADDVSFSLFASKLRRSLGSTTLGRPINVQSRWNSSTMMHDGCSRQQGIPPFASPCQNDYIGNFEASHFGVSRLVSSPETEPNSYSSMKASLEEVEIELNSPSSIVSSLCQEKEVVKTSEIQDRELQELGSELDDDDDDEVMSSYVIEINSDYREGTEEALGIDEAIAWAKEKFQTHSSPKDWNSRQHERKQSKEMEERPNADGLSNEQTGGCGSISSIVETTEGNQPVEEDKEIQLHNEDIRLWSAGKEANIRLLLSSLHHILWPDGGWYPISISNLVESAHVKKAYQKARLCLHPDKLQQRGASHSQKYVAEKAFSILQDAWDAFLSQDVCFS